MVRKYLVGTSILFWLIAVSGGFFALLNYSNAPGDIKRSGLYWPKGSRILQPADLPVLIIALHPQCPCSRATVTELEKLMAHLQGRVRVYALFAKPAGLPDKKVYSDLWERAKKIPGVEVILDETGNETRLFGSRISGETFLYSREGRLVFHGGITVSRGHEGENVGIQTVSDFVLKNKMGLNQTAVFGCPLLNARTRKDFFL